MKEKAKFTAGSNYDERENLTMARWPDDQRSTIVTFLLIFLLFPLLCWLAWSFVGG